MTSVLRLATLSYAIALVDASFSLWPDRDAGGNGNGYNWGPAKQTAGLTEIDPVGWTPKPTAPPGATPFDLDLDLDLDLRRRQSTTISSAATCGFPADNISAPAITCTNGEYCLAMQWQSVAGCCSESNRRDCRVPTTCVESSTQTATTTQTDSRTLVCDDPAKPHCVTYLYNADFFENLNGFSFLACGSSGEAASSTIGTTPPPGWLSTIPGSGHSTTSGPSTTGTEPTNAVTITVFPGTSSSASSTPIAAATSGSGVSRTGAIVGGTVGGCAGLALILAAIFFFLRYRRRRGAEGKGIESSPPYPRRSYPAASVYPSGLPEPQYTSDFYGELPPQMAQSSTQHMTGYPPPTTFEHEHNYESHYEPHYEPVAVPREIHRPTRPSTFVPGSPKPNEEDIVSPITPGGQLNSADDPATYTWISNPTPPPQSEYSQYSPPPPPQFQSYRPYPGT
ncbi:hypothetical protein GGR53DRAFT_112856 [Hypoxylon sp. FL1150]|nr:hypothetical protein GGR53DRAFT_112856 [Hypoxylon sp. FL1150]